MSKEREARAWPGWPLLALTIALYAFGSVMLALDATWQIWTGLGRRRSHSESQVSPIVNTGTLYQ